MSSQPRSHRFQSLNPLPWFRSWARRAHVLHGLLIAQLILMPFPPSSHAVWIEVDTDGDGIMDSGYDDGTSPPSEPPPENPPPTGDSDGDGLSDADEAAAGSDPYNPDSDGDGLTDADEINQAGSDPTTTDSDGDGISDYNEQYGNGSVDEDEDGPGETPYDHDGDGIPDPVDPDPTSPDNDPDSDGDGVPDSQDSNPTNPGVWNDANGNGINDDAENTASDSDGDGVSNDTDSHPGDPSLYNDWNYNGVNDPDEDWDGDGVSNLQDSHPNYNILWCDWNGNGINDDAEANLGDDDGDFVPNNTDSHPFNGSLWEDWNGNGCNDSTENNNADGDPAPDYLDSDPNDSNLWEDWNRNGTNDSQEYNPDRDGDGSENNSDSDPDNGQLWSDWNRNGVNDDQENTTPQDDDGDGQPNESDSDPVNPNLWEDWNRNGYNDSTEGSYLDDDGDGHANAFDSHPQDASLWSDSDNNGINDENEVIVTDSDGDGYSDQLDTHPQNASLWNDHNNNGINDDLEAPPDSDGDGVLDYEDAFPNDYDNDGVTDAGEVAQGTNPALADSDGDGLGDGEEVYAGTDPLNVDTDQDGLTDYEELRAYFTDPLSFTPPLGTSGEGSTPGEGGDASGGEGDNSTGGEGNGSAGGGETTPSVPVLMVEQKLGANVSTGRFLPAGTAVSFPSVSMQPDKSDQKSTLILHNKGTAPLTGLSVSIEGANKTKFTATPLPVTTTLAPGATTSLVLTFTGTAAAAAALHVYSDDPQMPIFVLPLRAIAGDWSPHKSYFFADMRDDDSDGIPNLVEELYSPLVVTADGDLDGNGVTNLDQYLSGLHLINDRAKSGDFDGDGLSDAEERAWGAKYGAYTNPYRFADAFWDLDADGLLTIEELKPRWGGQADVQACATNPFVYSTGPSNGTSSSTYNLSVRTAPPLNVLPKDAWKERGSTYFFWMPDGLLRLARRDFTSMGNTEFYAPRYRYQLPLPTPNPTGVNDGWDHLPNGYAMWLHSLGVTFPVTPGVPVGTHPVSGQLPWVSDSESQSKIIRALYLRLKPGSSNMDDDTMPDAWEASYNLDWREKLDAGLSYDENNLVPEFAIKGPPKPVFSDPVTEASVAAYIAAYNIWYPWHLMNLADPDHDGLPNWREHALGQNPRVPDYAPTSDRDSDGDTFTDAEEVAAGTDYRNSSNFPTFTLHVISGNSQSVRLHQQLPQPLVVEARSQGGVKAGLRLRITTSLNNNQVLLAAGTSVDPDAWKLKTLEVVTDSSGRALIQLKAPHTPLTLTTTVAALIKTTVKVAFTTTVSRPAQLPLDSDGDGMPDSWETAHGLDRLSALDADASPLHYGYHRDTPPSLLTAEAAADLSTAKDAWGKAVHFPSVYQSNPRMTESQWKMLLKIDPDHDGVCNLDEFRNGKAPKDADKLFLDNLDFDGDGFSDIEEAREGTNIYSSASRPVLKLKAVAGSGQTCAPGEELSSRIIVNARIGSRRPASPLHVASENADQVAAVGSNQWHASLDLMPDLGGNISFRVKTANVAGNRGVVISSSEGAASLRVPYFVSSADGGGTTTPTTPGDLPSLGTTARPHPASAKIVAYVSYATGYAWPNSIILPFSPEGGGSFASYKEESQTSESFMRTTVINSAPPNSSTTVESSNEHMISSFDYRVIHPVRWLNMTPAQLNSGILNKGGMHSSRIFSKTINSVSGTSDDSKTTTSTFSTGYSESDQSDDDPMTHQSSGHTSTRIEIKSPGKEIKIETPPDTKYPPQVLSPAWVYDSESSQTGTTQTSSLTGTIRPPQEPNGVDENGTYFSTTQVEINDPITPGQIYAGMLTDLSKAQWSEWVRVELPAFSASSTSAKSENAASGYIAKWRLSYELPEGARAADYDEAVVAVTSRKVLPNGEVSEAKEYIKVKPGKDSDVYTCDATDIPGSSLEIKAAISQVQIDSRDRAVTGKIPHLGTSMGGNKKFEIGFQAGGKSLGKYEIPQSGSPQGVHIYNSEDEIFGPEETEDLDGLSSVKKNQQVVLVREGSDIRFYTVSDDIGTFKVQLYLDGSLIGTVDHQLTAEDDFKRLLAAVEGFVAGDAPPAIKAWEPWPNVTLPLPALPALADNQLNDTLGAAPAVVASEVPSIESLRDPEFFNAFVVRVRQVATESEWTSFVTQLATLGYDANAALAAAAAPPPAAEGQAPAAGSVYPNAGALKTELNLPPEIRNRGMVARVVIYWVKRVMKTQVATGEGVVFGLWDGVKGDAEGFVDMFRTLGQVFSSPWKTASELYHTFKAMKDMTFADVKTQVQGMFDEFLANQQDRLEWALEGESSDPVYMGFYMGGYLGGYIFEQVLVTIGTAGFGHLAKGKYISAALKQGRSLMPALSLNDKIPKNFAQVMSRYVRTADEGRSVPTFANRCTSGNCFAAGTLVMMANGNSKVIEEVERGEWIITDDPNDNEPPKPAKVEWLIRNRTERLYTVEWDRDGDGRTDAHVRATSEHPFYALGRGWTPAKDLQPGDRIQTHQQRTVTVTGNHAWITPSATYNLDVGEPHTYFVGNSESWLLVHNVEYETMPWGILSTPNENHHGIMNEWLSQHFPTTYLGRVWEEDFPCVELSPENHAKATAVERQFRQQKGLPPFGNASWKDVTPQEAIKLMKDSLRAAGAPDELWKVVLNQTNGWLKTNMHKWRCP